VQERVSNFGYECVSSTQIGFGLDRVVARSRASPGRVTTSTR
jgi:hypothetical protein